jgi:ElaB/YqjD/DUF883 family membrane-anchored ribosome-binding protein
MTDLHTPTFPTSNGGTASAVDRAADKIAEAGVRASEVARRGAHQLSESTQQVKARLNEVSDSAIAYVKDEPVRAMLIAAGVGAALMALAGMLGRTRH